MGLAPMRLSWLGADADGTLPVTRDLEGGHVLVPLLTSAFQVVSDQLRVAAAVARTTDASLTVMDPTATTERVPTAYRHDVAGGDDRELVGWATERAADRTASGGGFTVDRHPVTTVLRAVDVHDVDTLVLPGTSKGSILRRGVTERIATQAESDVVVVNGRPGYDDPASILLPIAGGPHSGLATDVAGQVAADCGAWIDVLHVLDEDAPERRRRAAETTTDAAAQRIGRPETTSTWVLEASVPEEAIAHQSRYYGLTVVGAPTAGRLRRFVRGSTNRSVRSSADSVVLSARNNTGIPALFGGDSE